MVVVDGVCVSWFVVSGLVWVACVSVSGVIWTTASSVGGGVVWQGLPFLFRQVCVEASSCCGVSVGGLAGAGAASTTSILGLGEGGEAGGAAWETAWFFRGKASIAPEGRGGSLLSRLGQPLNQAWWLPPQLGHRAAQLFPVLSVSIHCEKGCFPLHTPQRSPVLQYFCKVKGRRERPTERHFDLPRGLSATVTCVVYTPCEGDARVLQDRSERLAKRI